MKANSQLSASFATPLHGLGDAITEVARRSRFSVWYYIITASVTVGLASELSSTGLIEVSVISGLLVLAVMREASYRLLTADASSHNLGYWLLGISYVVLALIWSSFVVFTVAAVNAFSGPCAALIVATSGFIAGALIALVPLFSIIRIYLAGMLLLPVFLFPVVLEGSTAWFLSLLTAFYFFYLYTLGKNLTQRYWERIDTQNRLAQQTLATEKHRDEAVQASKVKSQFLARMSHEIRTPMNGIIGMIDMLDADIKDPRSKEQLSIIQTCSKTLLSIVNDILDFSKLESGNMVLHPEPCHLQAFMDEMVTLFSAMVRDKRIQLESDLTQAPAETLLVDHQRLRQILFNLLGNAIKFTEQGFVRVRLQVAKRNTEHCTVVFSVEDTGPGIPAEHLSMIFEEFGQSSRHFTKAGAGLGLSITHQLVELMGGDLSVSSEVGQGSIFTVQLTFDVVRQLEGGQHLEAFAPSPELLDDLGFKVLVVEDNSVNRKVIGALLGRLGCSAEVIEDGRQVPSWLEQESFDVILMDCEMPVMDGFETTRLVRGWEQQHQRQRIPIIALSAHVLDETKEQCLACGMDDFLQKPARLELLKSTLIQHVRSGD